MRHDEWRAEETKAKVIFLVKGRNNRQDAIREIVRGKSIRTQRVLVQELEDAG